MRLDVCNWIKKLKKWNTERKRGRNRHTKRNIVAPRWCCRQRRCCPAANRSLCLAYCRCLWLFERCIHFIAFFSFSVVFFYSLSRIISRSARCGFVFWAHCAFANWSFVNLPSSRCIHKFKIRDVNSRHDQVNVSAVMTDDDAGVYTSLTAHARARDDR